MDECWEWQGTRRRDGYGVVYVDGRQRRAHRVAYEQAYGPIPAGRSVCHRCDNPPCVRPSHLFVATQADNLADMRGKGRHFSPFRGQVQRGATNRNAKLTEEAVLTIRRLAEEGMLQRDIAARFGIDRANVSHIVRRKSWATI